MQLIIHVYIRIVVHVAVLQCLLSSSLNHKIKRKEAAEGVETFEYSIPAPARTGSAASTSQVVHVSACHNGPLRLHFGDSYLTGYAFE